MCDTEVGTVTGVLQRWPINVLREIGHLRFLRYLERRYGKVDAGSTIARAIKGGEDGVEKDV